MRLREFEKSDQRSVIELWNRCLPFDKLDNELFRKKVTGDENFSPSLALCLKDGRNIVGFGYAMKRKVPYYSRGLEKEKGWICILFVDPMYRRMGEGRHIYMELEKRLMAAGAKEIILGAYSPNYFVPGIDTSNTEALKFFGSLGYIYGEHCYSMCRTLMGYQIPIDVQEKKAEAESKGFRFIHFKPEYAENAGRFLKDNFSSGWYWNVQVLLREKKAEKQLYICLAPSNEVVGFCMIGMDGNPNRFGPFGVAESYRNHSLGSIMFCNVMYELACQGIYFLYFLSTDANGRRFYERYGMECCREFVKAKKTL